MKRCGRKRIPVIGLRQSDPNREKSSRQKPSRSQSTPLHFLYPRVGPLQWVHFGGVRREYSLTAEVASAGEAHAALVGGGGSCAEKPS